MDKRIAGLMGAAGALVALGSAQAATVPDPTESLKASSYADLLKPIPNALSTLEALDNVVKPLEVGTQVAQYYDHHHHHHHHNSYYRRYRPRVIVVPRERRFYHDHHHHHHHHSYYRRYRGDD